MFSIALWEEWNSIVAINQTGTLLGIASIPPR